MLESPIVLTAEEFQLWKEMPVTQALFQWIEDEIDKCNLDLSSSAHIMEPTKGQLELCRLFGEKSAYEVIMSLSVEDVRENDKHEEDNTSPKLECA